MTCSDSCLQVVGTDEQLGDSPERKRCRYRGHELQRQEDSDPGGCGEGLWELLS